MESANVSKEDIGQIVFVSSTDFSFPGLDTEIIKILDLPKDVYRVPLYFQGCSAGVRGIAASDIFCQNNPGETSIIKEA